MLLYMVARHGAPGINRDPASTFGEFRGAQPSLPVNCRLTDDAPHHSTGRASPITFISTSRCRTLEDVRSAKSGVCDKTSMTRSTRGIKAELEHSRDSCAQARMLSGYADMSSRPVSQPRGLDLVVREPASVRYTKLRGGSAAHRPVPCPAADARPGRTRRCP